MPDSAGVPATIFFVFLLRWKAILRMRQPNLPGSSLIFIKVTEFLEHFFTEYFRGDTDFDFILTGTLGLRNLVGNEDVDFILVGPLGLLLVRSHGEDVDFILVGPLGLLVRSHGCSVFSAASRLIAPIFVICALLGLLRDNLRIPPGDGPFRRDKFLLAAACLIAGGSLELARWRVPLGDGPPRRESFLGGSPVLASAFLIAGGSLELARRRLLLSDDPSRRESFLGGPLERTFTFFIASIASDTVPVAAGR